jgi:hypothetical protein
MLITSNCRRAAPPAQATARPIAGGPLWAEPQFTAMLQAYRQRLPGKQRVFEFAVYGGSASLAVQDPANLKHVDSYDYQNGSVAGPAPVDVSDASGKLEDHLFAWDQVAIERIPALVQEALRRTKVESPEIGEVSVAVSLDSGGDAAKRPGPKPAEITVSFKGPRGYGSLTADAKGTVHELHEE